MHQNDLERVMGKKPCKSCQWFRRGRPLSQLLLEELGILTAELSGELKKLIDDETQTLDAEEGVKVTLINRRVDVWGQPAPSLTDHCGLGGAHFVHEVKNQGGDCGAYLEHDRRRRSCSTCRHRRPGDGPARDAVEYADIERRVLAAAVWRERGDMRLFDEYAQKVASAKSLEVATAYRHGKFLRTPPAYLSVCAWHSGDGTFVPCAVQNRHEECPDWLPLDTKELHGRERVSLAEALEFFGGAGQRPKAPAAPPPAGAPVPTAPVETSAAPDQKRLSLPLVPEEPREAFGCPACVNYREAIPPAAHLASSAAGGRSREELERENERRREDEENQVRAGKPLKEKPHFKPWCAYFTPSREVIAQIKRGLANGDTGPSDQARAAGYVFAINYTEGRVDPLYVLCAVRNPKGDCKYFNKKREETP
jgi:hypothetical protein